MIKKMQYIFFFINFSLLTANTIFVPSDFITIQLAIDNADSGDTVIVNPGLYTENITIDNLSISLIASNGSESTIIDGNLSGSVIQVNSQESVLIRGFTIQNGIGELLDGSRFGGGILSHNSLLTLDSLIIKNNEAFAGGGVSFYDIEESEVHPLLSNSLIENNIASEGGGVFVINQFLTVMHSIINNNGMVPYGSGGGIQALVSNVYLEDVSLINNHSRFGGGIYTGSSEVYITNSIISNNLSDSKGGGMWVGSDSELELVKTIISDNFADGFGGGIFVSLSWLSINKSTISSNSVSATVSGAGIYIDGGDALIQNSIIYFNRKVGSESVNHNLDGYSSSYLIEYDVEYSDIEGSGDWLPYGVGVISLDPEFEEESYYLMASSPCIDAGCPDYTDPDGTILDLGAYYFNQLSCGDLGDLNNNSIVDILDIIILANIIIGSTDMDDFCADINDDMDINILDIISLIQIILDV